ncbi:phosphotyrosine-specific ptp2-like protein, partial [Coemansia sp. RSA 2424]
MINSRGVVTEANQYTISAGIELGSKNRYTTILPFDSNRVRLQQRRSSKPAVNTPTPAVSKPAVNKPLPPLPPGTPLETPVGGISGSAAHLRLRMQGDRPVSYDHGAACTQAVAAKRSSQRVEMRTQGKALLVDADDGADDDEGGGAAALLGALPAGAGKGQSEAGGADYINASFLRYGGGPLYIAAQGPLASTTGDFWHMVWEQRARVVVMLTRSTEHGRAKCHAYWPDCVGQAAAYGGIRVLWEAEAQHPDDASVVARRLRLTSVAGGASAVVTHLQYLGWPDHGVPENPLGVLRLRQLARAAQADAAAPMVVHCSAG